MYGAEPFLRNCQLCRSNEAAYVHWLQDSSQINGDNSIQETSKICRYFIYKMENICKSEWDSKKHTREIRDLYSHVITQAKDRSKQNDMPADY
jgi:hypothetical protein